MKYNSLKKLTLLYSIGSFTSKIFNFGLVFILTYFYTKEEIGEYDIVMTVFTLGLPIISLQLSDAVLRWVIEDKSSINLISVFSNVLIIQLCNIAITGLFFCVVNYFFNYQYFILLFTLISLNSLLVFFQQFLRGQKKNEIYILSSIVYSVIFSLIAVFGVVYFDFKINDLLLSNIFSSLLLILILFFVGDFSSFFNYRKINLEFSKKLTLYSINLIPNAISWWLIVSANRFVISYYLGNASNGLFSIAFKFPTIIMLVIQTFQLAWQEKAMDCYESKNRDEYFSSVLKKYIVVLLILSIVFLLFNKLLIRNLVSVNFYEAWKYTSILLLGVIFSSISSFIGSIFLSLKQTKSIFHSSFIGGLLSIIFSLILIPEYGLYGAALSLVIGFFVVMILRLNKVLKLTKIIVPYKLLLELFFLYLIIMKLEFIHFDFIFFIRIAIFSIYLVVRRKFFIQNFLVNYEK
ncbi:hypothetical protein EGI22_15890 [Lacihabitans sp. LS3-19]|uniref:lipopolysaccharide biosynthesis protein n=1 Tax=Lacihabitans sp. LS3-19 TaxID=2487335 RepID=UPI0020CED3F5|nr:polysaccharide biosynthesis C-terminal domain-containing protein [Lacihabitans sp. LS3-19]MCP9769386.1 hypothetical protein [Lacihabitans sp. LS3-19]